MSTSDTLHATRRPRSWSRVWVLLGGGLLISTAAMAQGMIDLGEDQMAVDPERPNASYLLQHSRVVPYGSLSNPGLDAQIGDLAPAEGSGEGSGQPAADTAEADAATTP